MLRWLAFGGGFLAMNLTGSSARAQSPSGGEEILEDRVEETRAGNPSEQASAEPGIAALPISAEHRR